MDLVWPLWRYIDERIAGWCHCFAFISLFWAHKCSRIHRALIARSLFFSSFFRCIVLLMSGIATIQRNLFAVSRASQKNNNNNFLCVCLCLRIHPQFGSFCYLQFLLFIAFFGFVLDFRHIFLATHVADVAKTAMLVIITIRWRTNHENTHTQNTLTHTLLSAKQTKLRLMEREGKAPIDLILLSFAIRIQSSGAMCEW